MNQENPTETTDKPDDDDLDEQDVSDDFYLVWEVWSIKPRGFRSSCKRIFLHDEWQFAEKYAARLRASGHEEVEVELSTREDAP